jgi:hypothetical protein
MIREAIVILVTLTACFASGGCASAPSRALYGKTFYVGGAGYSGPIGTFNVPCGLMLAGYDGQVEMFLWQSWKGAVLDQAALDRNKARARELAAKMCDYLDHYPGRELNVIALSAGCGVTAFAIESLPERYKLNNVVFLGCSLSMWYDLTKMLRHLRGGLYVYHSPSDLVLSHIVPITGTVDRKKDPPAGQFGFSPPVNLSHEGRLLYSKVLNIPWRPEFAKYGYFGQHIDTIGFGFIRYEVAKRIMTRPLEHTPPVSIARHRGAPPRTAGSAGYAGSRP